MPALATWLQMCVYSYLCAALGHSLTAIGARSKVRCSNGRTSMDEAAKQAHRHNIRLRFEAERLLGPPAWFIVESYGKVMDGPSDGRWVSLLSGEEKLGIAKRLNAGETVNVHLMHRPCGKAEIPSLRLGDGQLIMVYSDHEEAA